MKQVFEFPTFSEEIFFCNRDTGKWALARRLDQKVSDHLRSIPPLIQFSGTSMIVLNISSQCNFGCVYCHIRNKDSTERMSYEVADASMKKILALPEEDRVIVFHGSEPLTNFELIQKMVDSSNPSDKLKFRIQTNGSLLDDQKIKYFAEKGVGLGISLDGCYELHDANRPFLNGGSSYKLVLKNLQLLAKSQSGVSVITVVSKNNVSHLEEIVRDFEFIGIDSVTFSPLFSSPGLEYLSPDQEILTKQMKLVFENYLDRVLKGERPIKVQNVRDMLRTIFRTKITSNCVKCGGGEIHPLLGIDINGDIYPCDFFWGKKAYKMGNILEIELSDCFNSLQNIRVYRDANQIEGCAPCDWKMFCGGGCPGGSVVEGKGIYAKTSYCDYQKEMLQFLIKRIPMLHKKRLLGRLLQD